MYEKCNIQNKKGFLKIHVAIVVIDIKTKEILAFKVSDERVYDEKMLNFVNHVLDSSSSNRSESNTVK